MTGSLQVGDEGLGVWWGALLLGAGPHLQVWMVLWRFLFLITPCPSTGQAGCSWPAWLPRTPGPQGDLMSHLCPSPIPTF